MRLKLSGTVLTVAVPVLLLDGCVNPVPEVPTQTDNQRAQVRSRIEPTVRRVADADQELLWRAAHDYMERAFPLGIDDPAGKVVETQLLEWDHDRMSHRTVVTVQLVEDPKFPRHTQLRCVAQRIQAEVAFERAQTGEPIPKVWVLHGNDRDIENIVTDQIVRRYLLLREGRDPDLVPIVDPPQGLRKRPDGLPSGARAVTDR